VVSNRQKAKWSSFAGVRATFGAADLVDRFIVFDIGGNKYRLIAAIHFNRGQTVYSACAYASEYDAGKWKDG